MRLSPLLSRISLFTSLPALAFALVAIFGVRSGVFSLALGMQVMLPAVALGLIGFVTGAAWTWLALRWPTGMTPVFMDGSELWGYWMRFHRPPGQRPGPSAERPPRPGEGRRLRTRIGTAVSQW